LNGKYVSGEHMMTTESNSGTSPKLSFTEYWALQDGRRNFGVDPENVQGDGDLFFGGRALSDNIKDRISDGYIINSPPKIYLEGSWGAGKTHSLLHVKRHLETAESPDGVKTIPIYLDIECYGKTDYQYLHEEMLEGITQEKVKHLMTLFLAKNAGNLEEAEADTIKDHRIAAALRAITIGGSNLPGWKYLLGKKLSNPELAALNNVGAIEGVSSLIDILNVIGKLAQQNDERFIFLIDEAELLHDVTDTNAQNTFTNAMLRLTESPTIGFLMTFIVEGNAVVPEFMATAPIVQRMGGEASRIYIDNLAEDSPDRSVRDFLQELLDFMISADKKSKRIKYEGLEEHGNFYPFTESSKELFISSCMDLNDGAVSPRMFIEFLNRCAVAAYQRDTKIFTDEIVEGNRMVVAQSLN